MNPDFDKPPQEVLAQFQQLKEAMIDASSIIYACKAGLINVLQANLKFMMLNFLSYIDAIDRDQYSHYYTLLQKIAWYSPKIWHYGSSVLDAIEKSR